MASEASDLLAVWESHFRGGYNGEKNVILHSPSSKTVSEFRSLVVDNPASYGAYVFWGKHIGRRLVGLAEAPSV